MAISDSTMNDWYAATCEKLKLLYDILKRETLSRDYIQVDESTLPVIDNEKHRAVKGYMWCVRAVEDNLVVFHYDMGSRSYETARMWRMPLDRWPWGARTICSAETTMPP